MSRRIAGVALITAVMVMGPPVPATGVERIARVTHTVLEAVPALATGLSQPIVAPNPFSLIGVSVPEGTRVLLRTADASGDWSPWVEAEPLADDGDGPDRGSAEDAASHLGWERMSAPIWVGEASGVQVRVIDGEAGEVALHLIDSLGLSRSLWQRVVDAWRGTWKGMTPADANAGTHPPIVSRAQWGADESLRGHDPDYSSDTRAGILHHTATSNTYSREEAAGIVRAIYSYHTQSLGWSDIGYNLLVDRFGTVYEGRAGGLERGVVGSHSGGFNTETFGISVIGTFTSGLPPGPALDALAGAVGWMFRVHGIDADPNATVDITSRGSTRYPEGHLARMHTLSGHRDVSATACPGDALYAHLSELRRLIHAPPSAEPVPPQPPAPDRGLLPRLGLRDLGLPDLRLPLGDRGAPPQREPAADDRSRLELPLRDLLPLRGSGGAGR